MKELCSECGQEIEREGVSESDERKSHYIYGYIMKHKELFESLFPSFLEADFRWWVRTDFCVMLTNRLVDFKEGKRAGWYKMCKTDFNIVRKLRDRMLNMFSKEELETYKNCFPDPDGVIRKTVHVRKKNEQSMFA